MPIVWLIVLSVIILALYNLIKKSVSKANKLEDTDLDTDLKEFRESHAVSTVIRSGALDLKESVVQRYERMCILDPYANKDDMLIPKLISDYQEIISGRVLDPEGLNIPSEEILGRHNPDYDRYLSNQARAQKKASLTDSARALRKESSRVNRVSNENLSKNHFFAYLVEQGVPALVVSAALTEGKLNSYTADDWKLFCKSVKGYIEISSEFVVMNFVELFDDKEVILDLGKFENFVVFSNFKVPAAILKELIRGRITSDQAIKIIDLVQECHYSWDGAMEEILRETLEEVESNELRVKYGWKG